MPLLGRGVGLSTPQASFCGDGARVGQNPIFVQVERTATSRPGSQAVRASGLRSRIGAELRRRRHSARSFSFVPTYVQIVKGASASASGLGLPPLIAGLLLTSTASGLIVSRTGRYKALPSLGLGVNTFGTVPDVDDVVDTPMPWIAALLFASGSGSAW